MECTPRQPHRLAAPAVLEMGTQSACDGSISAGFDGQHRRRFGKGNTIRGSDTQSRLCITTLKHRWSRVTNPYEFAPILVGRVEAARLLSISVQIDRLRLQR
jgi:hypothetical protein